MNQNKQYISEINSHVEDYLDYYCGLPYAPEYAVLLKGDWGSGKTWFIKKYQEKLEIGAKQGGKKCLYVSLYGMTSFSEIEFELFLQLYKPLDSKPTRLAAKLIGSIVGGTAKLGGFNFKIPSLQDFLGNLKNTDDSILIFDDLERCKINFDDILGYINSFVEHQELKVIVVANEQKLFEDKTNKYSDIKEKLIGKTFDVHPDLDSALKAYIDSTNDSKVKRLLLENTDLIQELYIRTNFRNLRILRQIVLDFERIFQKLSDKAKSSQELVQELLKLLVAFSIEIKCGEILPQNIFDLHEAWEKRYKPQQRNDQMEKEKLALRIKLVDKYLFLKIDISAPFPGGKWWYEFFDKGLIDIKTLEEILPNSKYFKDEYSRAWVRLWYFSNLSDDEFEDVISEVDSQFRACL
jgi:DNA-directed RNA polymerase subunit F